jgi:hypothetical protein
MIAGRIPEPHQQQVYKEAACSAVTIEEGMDALELRVQLGDTARFNDEG